MPNQRNNSNHTSQPRNPKEYRNDGKDVEYKVPTKKPTIPIKPKEDKS